MRKKQMRITFIFLFIISLCFILFSLNKDTPTQKELYFDQQDIHYTGTIEKNKFNGDGTINFKNGDTYTGNFVDGRFNGEGTFTSHSGWHYTGEFVNGQPNGYGVLTTEKGAIFKGDFIKGVFQENEN